MGYFDNNDIVRPTHDFNHDGHLNPSEDLLAGVRWSEIEEEANAAAARTEGASYGTGVSFDAGSSYDAAPNGCVLLVKWFVRVGIVVSVFCAACSFIYDSGWIVGGMFTALTCLIVFAICYVFRKWI